MRTMRPQSAPPLVHLCDRVHELAHVWKPRQQAATMRQRQRRRMVTNVYIEVLYA